MSFKPRSLGQRFDVVVTINITSHVTSVTEQQHLHPSEAASDHRGQPLTM